MHCMLERVMRHGFDMNLDESMHTSSQEHAMAEMILIRCVHALVNHIGEILFRRDSRSSLMLGVVCERTEVTT